MSESRNKIDFKKFIQASFKALKHLFLHNGWLKLISILISLVLWAGLISQDASLTRDKTFQNVNVNIIGNDTLINNGFIVVSNLDDLSLYPFFFENLYHFIKCCSRAAICLWTAVK